MHVVFLSDVEAFAKAMQDSKGDAKKKKEDDEDMSLDWSSLCQAHSRICDLIFLDNFFLTYLPFHVVFHLCIPKTTLCS